MSIRALIFDLETTHKGGPDNDSPEAHWPINEVVMAGWCTFDGGVVSPIETGTLDDLMLEITDDYQYLVAHNLKFDLKYIMRNCDYPNSLGYNNLWCTMTHEYLVSGHEHKFISLEDACDKRGIVGKKTFDLSAYIEAGGTVETMPKDQLEEYLKMDVELLWQLFISQLKDKHKYDMDYIYPLAEMELNGLPVNDEKLKYEASVAHGVCDTFIQYMKNKIKVTCEWVDGSPVTDADFEKKIKPTANRTLSFLITGEPEKLKTTSDKWTLQFKQGGKTVVIPSIISSIWPDKPNHLGYSMDEKHVDKLCTTLPKHWATMIPEWRKHDKLLNTYYLPFINMSQFTGCVHPKLNTTATATGRLSSSRPNGQNMPKEARELIQAPEDWFIGEIDFSQLEVVALAMLCKDKQLIEDINNGEDIHFNTGKMVMGWRTPDDMDKETRRKVKNVNFGAIYGGKAPGLSYQTGIDKGTVQKLINHLYHRYPGIATWQRSFYEDVVENLKPNGHDADGEQMYKSTVEQGGRTYTFFETPSPRWLRAKMGRSYSFNPNQVYNYPIQGYAGWAIVLQYLRRLWGSCAFDEVRFLMTVHDSILIMFPKNELRNVQNTITTSLEMFREEHDIDMPLNLNFEWNTHWS